jgi:hypothetical protein
MNGKIATINETFASVATQTHPAVKKTLPALASQGVLPAGMLYALNADGKVIPYVRDGAAPANALKGVVDKDVDTSEDDAAIGIVHGTVSAEALAYGINGDAVTVADLAALEAITVFPE